MFNVLQQISLPGSENNDDRLLVSDNYLVLLDGATSLVPSDNDAAWFTDTFMSQFEEQIRETQDLPSAINASIADVKKIFVSSSKNRGALYYPSAAGILMFLHDDMLQFVSIGDCTAVIKFNDGKEIRIHKDDVDTMDNRVLEAIRTLSDVKRLTRNEVLHTIEIRNMLVHNRKMMNKKAGYRILSVNMKPISKEDVDYFAPNDISSILLFSDGFDICEDELRREDPDFQRAGLILRQRESKDTDLSMYPRFKMHDDATAVLCTVK